MLTLPLLNTSLQYLCPTVDSRHRSACLVSALHECPHWRVFGDLLRLTHCIPAPAAVSAVSAPAVRRTPHCGHLRSGSCAHARTWHGMDGGESLTTSLISTRTYQIFKLKSIFFFYYIRHAHFHSYSDAKYCPVEPNLGKCKATWLRFALLIQFSHNSKFNTWFWLCWSVILYSIYPAHLIPWCFHERGSVI